MKTLLAFSLVLPLVGGMLFTKSSGRNQKPSGAVVSYQYTYSTTMAYPVTFYQVERDSKGEIQIAWLNQYGPDVCFIRGSEEVLKQIGTISAQYKLHRLKNHYYPSVEILDGDSWHTYLRFEKGSISSGGNNASAPAKLMEGIHRINSYLQSVIDASTEEDIIRREDYRDFRNRY